MNRMESKRVKILIVEDDKTTRLVLGHLLRGLGNVELIEASDGMDAWRQLEEGLMPDLCLVDILMPGLDGLGLLQRIRAHTPTSHLPVLICSNAKERQRIAEAVSLRVSGYVLKPFQAKFLQAEVRRVLGKALAAPSPTETHASREVQSGSPTAPE